MEERRLGLRHFLLHQDIEDIMTTHVKIFSIHRLTSSKDNDEYIFIHIDIKMIFFYKVCINNLLLRLIVL